MGMAIDLSTLGMGASDGKRASGLDFSRIKGAQTKVYDKKIEQADQDFERYDKKLMAWAALLQSLEAMKIRLEYFAKGLGSKSVTVSDEKVLEVSLQGDINIGDFAVSDVSVATRGVTRCKPGFTEGQAFNNEGVVEIVTGESYKFDIVPSTVLYHSKGSNGMFYSDAITNFAVLNQSILAQPFHVDSLSSSITRVSNGNSPRSQPPKLTFSATINGDTYSSNIVALTQSAVLPENTTIILQGPKANLTLVTKVPVDMSSGDASLVELMHHSIDGFMILPLNFLQNVGSLINSAYLEIPIGTASSIDIDFFVFAQSSLSVNLGGKEYSLELSEKPMKITELLFKGPEGLDFVIKLSSEVDASTVDGEMLAVLLNKEFGITKPIRALASVDIAKGDTLDLLVRKMNQTGLVTCYTIKVGEYYDLIVRSISEGRLGCYLRDITGLLKIAERKPGADASFKIDGNEVFLESNKFELVKDEVTIYLKADSAPGEIVYVGIGEDRDYIYGTLNLFSLSYNELRDVILSQVAKNEFGGFGEGKDLLDRNSVFRSVESALEQALAFRQADFMIDDLGLTKSMDGKLSFADEGFSSMMNQDGSVEFLVAFINSFLDVLEVLVAVSSPINGEIMMLKNEQSRIESQKEEYEDVRKWHEQQVVKKFSRLEAQVMGANSMLDMLDNYMKAYLNV